MASSDDAAMLGEGFVFLVEDDPAVRRSLSLLLDLHGFRCTEFQSAEDFLAASAWQRPACAVVDIRLPGMSGLALQARMMRKDRGFPVLLMTAQGDAAIARTAM
ncbi:MAG TPA: response regulator, partial [Burkholderiaceae bacterium]|nr:response regulator [Burkholderiaceae bacterium]